MPSDPFSFVIVPSNLATFSFAMSLALGVFVALCSSPMVTITTLLLEILRIICAPIVAISTP